MLIRCAACLASVVSAFAALPEAQGARFGKRQCCQSTPIQCPPCQPSIQPQPYNGTMRAFGSGVVLNECTPSAPAATVSQTVPNPLLQGSGEMVTEQRVEQVTVLVPIQEQTADGRTITRMVPQVQSRTTTITREKSVVEVRLEELEKRVDAIRNHFKIPLE